MLHYALAVPHATIDFETKSVAGFVWNDTTRKWIGLPGAPQGKKGLKVVGANAYAEHPSTRVLTLSYRLPGQPLRRWKPGDPLPQDLFDWIVTGGRVEAHNVMFERLIWTHVCIPLYGFPPLPPEQLQCSAATARVNQYPGALGNLGDVLQLDVRKDKDGRRLLEKFSIPRNPTKADARLWITPEDDPADAERLYSYCDDDVRTEQAASERMKPMSADERAFWLIDQEINWRGIAIDRDGVRACISILNQALEKYGDECRALTGGIGPSQVQQLVGWLGAHGVRMYALDAEAVEDKLKNIAPHPPGGIWPARRVLEIRALVGSASVKKLFSMEHRCSRDSRLRDLIVHHGARTGRPTGDGPQPLNLPKAGPKLATCSSCAKPYKPSHDACPWCAAPAVAGAKKQWLPHMVDHVLEIMALGSLELVEWFFGDALLAISGCIRGLFQAGPGMDLIASDYSAIEAVVTAMLANCQWRIDAFINNEPIYLLSASKITGTPVEEYLRYNEEHGEHHPDRQKIGKVAELGLGFGGWINAWLVFDDSGTFNEYQIKELIKAWREASPEIVELWGGQWRGGPAFGWMAQNATATNWLGKPYVGHKERFGFEGAAVNAIDFPGQVFEHAGIKFERKVQPTGQDALIVTLLSGRELTYHEPILEPSTRDYAAPGEMSISYMTWNSNPTYGMLGWVRMSTFGGRLTENIVQATAHDILRHAIVLLRAAGFPTVLHIYDEIVSEVKQLPAPLPPGVQDHRLTTFERIMMTMPDWCAHWPIRAAGGWVGKRYRKG